VQSADLARPLAPPDHARQTNLDPARALLLSEVPLQIVRLGEEEAGSESSEEMHFVNRARGATFQWLEVRGWYELRIGVASGRGYRDLAVIRPSATNFEVPA
jgi:hypothetical protein